MPVDNSKAHRHRDKILRNIVLSSLFLRLCLIFPPGLLFIKHKSDQCLPSRSTEGRRFRPSVAGNPHVMPDFFFSESTFLEGFFFSGTVMQGILRQNAGIYWMRSARKTAKRVAVAYFVRTKQHRRPGDKDLVYP